MSIFRRSAPLSAPRTPPSSKPQTTQWVTSPGQACGAPPCDGRYLHHLPALRPAPLQQSDQRAPPPGQQQHPRRRALRTNAPRLAGNRVPLRLNTTLQSIRAQYPSPPPPAIPQEIADDIYSELPSSSVRLLARRRVHPVLHPSNNNSCAGHPHESVSLPVQRPLRLTSRGTDLPTIFGPRTSNQAERVARRRGRRTSTRGAARRCRLLLAWESMSRSILVRD